MTHHPDRHPQQGRLLTGDRAAGLVLADPALLTRIAVADTETPAVRRAAAHLGQDLTAVCDADTDLSADLAAAQIVIATVGVSPYLADAAADGLDLIPLSDTDGTPHWEGFLLREHHGRLWIVGADRRGTVYGIYHLCEAIGVSPWQWWADVPPRRRDHVTVHHGAVIADYPSVRYRGIFLNDEEELEAWAKTHTSDGTIGPHTYERVYELLLRLKANYLWPAMHVNAFNADPDNGRLAEECGIVVGSSHCDILLRTNQNEWQPWLAGRADQQVAYDYSIPGSNRGVLHDYWRGSIKQNRDHEVTWTLGMRGIHDSGFLTQAIDDNPTLSPAEKHRARVELLSQVITDQRSLLAEVLGPQHAEAAPQLFVPYKEVLPLYNDGLEVPDDVTIVWSDDSYGHLRRHPTPTERARPGGHGLYYHASYWSPPSRSYLWISSTPLAQTKHELTKAWNGGICTLWVNNVGALKPLEQEIEFFLRYAWEIGKETTTADTTDYLTDWVDRTFTGGHGCHVATILQDYAQITDVRKVELLTTGVLAQIGYGDEALDRLTQLRALYDAINTVHAALPEPEQDAFMQLVAFKIHAAYLTTAQVYFADRSTLAHDQGKMQAADHYLTTSRTFDRLRRALICHYNTVLADGRWDQIMTPDAFPPPAITQYPAATPALTIPPEPGLGVVTWGDPQPRPDPRLRFSVNGTATKWVEIFNTGAGSLAVTLTADPWIQLGQTTATVTTEARIAVHVPDPQPGRHGRITVHSPTDEHTITVDVTVDPATRPVADAAPTRPAYLEADGYLSVPATQTSARHGGDRAHWVDVPRLGRGGSDALTAQPATAPRLPTAAVAAQAAVAEYRLQLTTAGAHLLELHRYLSLDATGRLRVGVSVDDHPPVVVESAITDEYRGTWTTAVVDNVERLQLRLPHLPAGPHALRLHSIDTGLTLSRLVIYTTPPRHTALGPPTSRRAGQPPTEQPWAAPDTHDLAGPTSIAHLVYRVDPDTLPLPPVVYVDSSYWDSETTFTRNTSVAQTTLGPTRHRTRPDGTKNVLADLPAGPARETGGRLAVEAEQALLGTADGWTTPGLDHPPVAWNHTQAETGGGTGLALHVRAPGRRWDDPHQAPGLHLRIVITSPGSYRAWALVKYDSTDDDSCTLAVDGVPQPLSEQFSRGSMCSFGTTQIWVWVAISDLTLNAGSHTLSVLAGKAGLRVDRLYLTLHGDRPPADADWPRQP